MVLDWIGLNHGIGCGVEAFGSVHSSRCTVPYRVGGDGSEILLVSFRSAAITIAITITMHLLVRLHIRTLTLCHYYGAALSSCCCY